MLRNTSKDRLPTWLHKKNVCNDNVHAIKTGLRKMRLHTVCEEARCPNIGECFARGTATFMILGDICTRKCGFCAVKNGEPKPLDPNEPKRVAVQVKELQLKHAVVTSVTRDDLADGGAKHFADTINEIRKLNPNTTIEVLTPDFEGQAADIKTVCDARPDIFNHNIETVERLTGEVRSKASYKRSLEVLKIASELLKIPPCPPFSKGGCASSNPPVKKGGRGDLIKSGLMLGLGETKEEVITTLKDLKSVGCKIVTIGQYLRPSKSALPVKEYLEPNVFKYYEKAGMEMGFERVFSAPLVRSSYYKTSA